MKKKGLRQSRMSEGMKERSERVRTLAERFVKD